MQVKQTVTSVQVNELEERIKNINKQIEELLLEQDREHEQFKDRKSKMITQTLSAQSQEMHKKLNNIREEDNLDESLNWLLSSVDYGKYCERKR